MKIVTISGSHASIIGEIPLLIRNTLVEVNLVIHADDSTHKTFLDDLRLVKSADIQFGDID